MAATITGFDRVIANLNTEIEKIQGASMAGLLESAAIVRTDMDKTPPLIPVDTNNLRQSWFVEQKPTATGPNVECGFSANYATYVHEMVGGGIEWKRPNSGPKFFEAALKRNKETILKTIQKNVEI